MRRRLAELFEPLYVRCMLALRSARRFFAPTARCDVHGVTIRLELSSEIEHYRAETYTTKEPETLAWLERELRDRDVFFDVGANIGLYALYAAKLRPSCRVFAFEPESTNFSRLCGNIARNDASNVTPCPFPLHDQEGFQWFHVYGSQPGSALHSVGGPSGFHKEPATMLQGALCATLDALVARHGFPAPSLLKLDVDGNEEKILTGGADLLRSGSLRSILVEVTTNGAGEGSWAERVLAPYGYVPVVRSDWVIEIEGLKSRNYIFERIGGSQP